MLKLFHQMFAHPGFRICAVLLLATGMLDGQERRPPILKGGIQQPERRRPAPQRGGRQQDDTPDQYSILKLIEAGCRVAREALDLYREAAANPDLVLSDRWNDVEDRAYQALAPCFSCPMGTLKIGIEVLRRAQIARLNPQARAEVYRRLIQLTFAHDPPRRPVSLQAFDQAVEGWKQKIQGFLQEAEACYQSLCTSLPRSCSASLPTPAVHRPSPIICTLQQLTGLLFERYETTHPFAIAKVSTNKPLNGSRDTYLILIAGTEYDLSQTNTPLAWGQEASSWVTQDRSKYRASVLEELSKRKIKPDSNFIIAGHSLGGMVAQNLAADSLFRKLAPRHTWVITFGAPETRLTAPDTTYLKVIGNNDFVPTVAGVIPGAGQVLHVDSDHGGYPDCAELGSFDALGQEDGSVCLKLDPLDLKSYLAPGLFSPETLEAEEIGERRMEREAACLGYTTLLSPLEASAHRQGYDAVYWDPGTCSIVIGEAKGGYNGVNNLDGLLGCAYKCTQGSCRPKCQQGTEEWAKAAASRIARSQVTNDTEVRTALQVLGAFQAGTPAVRIEVFHTKVNGGLEGAFRRYVAFPRDNRPKPPSCN